MEAKDAVIAAKRYLAELFQEERPMNVGLEELDYDELSKSWNVTLGFSRKWDVLPNPIGFLTSGESPLQRSYRILKVRDNDGKVLSIKMRDIDH